MIIIITLLVAVIFFVLCLILISPVLMLFGFFSSTNPSEYEDIVEHNIEFASQYQDALNKYMKDGYVPLSAILYFYLEDNTLSFDELYQLYQNKETKTVYPIEVVCENEKLKNMIACSEESIKNHQDFLVDQYFNFPLKDPYTITSFFKKERNIEGMGTDIHNGWDFAAPEKTPVYSVCNGIVTSVKFTQQLNIPYNVSLNKDGNIITIKCNDYGEEYNVIYGHLFPNSAKVKVGDTVRHWTEIAAIGQTGQATGNHLHYGVTNSNKALQDGMLFINMNNVR